MIPGDLTPIDDHLLAELMAADAAMTDSTGPQEPGDRSWLGHCARLLEAVWPNERPAASRRGAPPLAFGRFEVIRELGRGGFGVVYLARDPVLGRDVALKVPLPDRIAMSEVRRRFMREARAVAVLDHPHIVPVFEADELGPCAYIAAAYIAGPSLSDWLKSRTEPIPPRAAAKMVAALAGAVQHAHDRGILHRDLKPSNVLLQLPAARGGSASAAGTDLSAMVPRLTDFGLAKLGEDDGEETRSGVPLGSPPYMAPEQAAGRLRDIGPATDVYALGATLYEVLTGRAPFRGETPSETIRQVLERDPIPPRLLRADLPRDLETICLRCLHKDAHRRYPSAAALAEDLARFLAGRPILARPASARERLGKWSRRHPARAALVALAAILAAGVAGTMAWSNAWLRAHNERLRREIQRANRHADEADRQRRLAQQLEALADRHLHAAQLRLARQACRVGQFERAQEILLDDVYGPGPEHRDFAWWYLWRFSRREVALLGRHEAPVRRIELSPDGRTLASADAAGGLILWDTAAGRARAVLAGHAGPAEWLAFSPDGRMLASAGRRDPQAAGAKDLALWDVADGRLLGRPCQPLGGEVRVLTFLNGGLAVVVTSDARAVWSIRAWDVPPAAGPMQPSYSLEGFGFVAPFPDGGSFAVREPDGRLTLRDAASGRIRRTVSDREPEAAPLAVSRDGRYLAAAAAPSRILVWDLAGEAPPRVYADDEIRPQHLRFAPDGATLLAVAEGRQVVARDLATGRRQPLCSLNAGCLGSFDLTFSPDGRRLALHGYAQPGGTIPTAVWRLATGAREAIFPGRHSFQYLAFARDGQRLFLGGDHDVSVWRIQPSLEFDAFPGHRREAWAVAVAPDGRSVASGGDDDTLRIWDPSSGRERTPPMRHPATVSAVAYRPDGRVLATGCFDDRDGLRLWDAGTGRLVVRLPGHSHRVRSLAFSPDGRILASAGADRTIRLWEATTGAALSVLSGHADVVRAVAFAPDGRTLASASNDRTVRIWDVGRGVCRSVLPGRYSVATVAFAPDGRTLASADESGFITLRDPDAQTPRLVINADDQEVRALAFSPDGHTLASAGVARTVRLWDPLTGQELLGLDRCRGQVNALAFSPDGHTLLSADHAGFVRIYRGRPD
jgi:WD40 repeat protein/serine/threonine protein kinase